MNRIHLRRLRKLADFLDKMPKEKFDFSVVAIEEGKPMLQALRAGAVHCGTVACGMGWMPAAFPRQIKWQQVGASERLLDIALREPTGDSERDTESVFGAFYVAQEFFGITGVESWYLFNPGGHERQRNRLSVNARPQALARHIRRFADRKEKELTKMGC